MNAGFPEVFGSGIENLPEFFPVAPQINGSPIAGVLYTVVPDAMAVWLEQPVKVVLVLFE